MKTSLRKTTRHKILITRWSHPDCGQDLITVGGRSKENRKTAISTLTGGHKPKLLKGIIRYTSDYELKMLPEYEG